MSIPEPRDDERIMQPVAGADPQLAPWIWALEDCRRRTKQALAGLSDAALRRTPPEGGNSIGTLLYHLATIELSYLYEDILGQSWAPELDAILPYDIRDQHGLLVAVQAEDLATHLARLDRGRALLLATLRAMTADEWRRPRQVETYTITPEWAIHHLMQHEAEHRGEIGSLRSRAEMV